MIRKMNKKDIIRIDNELGFKEKFYGREDLWLNKSLISRNEDNGIDAFILMSRRRLKESSLELAETSRYHKTHSSEVICLYHSQSLALVGDDMIGTCEETEWDEAFKILIEYNDLFDCFWILWSVLNGDTVTIDELEVFGFQEDEDDKYWFMC